jgi:hypothetical protein
MSRNSLQKQHYIYLMRPVGMAGPIKIGCSYKPAKRLVQLSYWSPFPLEIIAVAPGHFDTERRIHLHFPEERMHAEWFQPSERVVAFASALMAGRSLDEALANVSQARAA